MQAHATWARTMAESGRPLNDAAALWSEQLDVLHAQPTDKLLERARALAVVRTIECGRSGSRTFVQATLACCKRRDGQLQLKMSTTAQRPTSQHVIVNMVNSLVANHERSEACRAAAAPTAPAALVPRPTTRRSADAMQPEEAEEAKRHAGEEDLDDSEWEKWDLAMYERLERSHREKRIQMARPL